MVTPEFNLPEGRTWLHVTCRAGDDSREVWYSPTRDVTATRNKELIEYREHKERLCYTFHVGTQDFYRTSEYEPRRPIETFEMVTRIPRFVRDGKLPEDPIKEFTFFDQFSAELELTSQSCEMVELDGQQWLQYRLALEHVGRSDHAEFECLVDAKTLLLHSVCGSGTWDGTSSSGELCFEYLEIGPADIHELGVPRTAKLDTLELTPKVQQIVDTLQRDRQRIDDYRAIVTERMDNSNYVWWLGHKTQIIYRKGSKFRVDRPHWFGGLMDYAGVDQPAADVDLEAWWRGRIGAFTYFPFYVLKDCQEFMISANQETSPDGSTQFRVESVNVRKCCGRPEDVFPRQYSYMPEFGCRPPLGIPIPARWASVKLTDVANPHNLSLLEVAMRQSGPTYCRGCNGQEILQPNVHRFWVDPARDFVAVRQDMVYVDENGKEQLIGSTLIEDFGQSPNGTWYAKRIRTKAVPPVDHDQVRTIYMDFNPDLPDSFFEPPNVGDTFQ